MMTALPRSPVKSSTTMLQRAFSLSQITSMLALNPSSSSSVAVHRRPMDLDAEELERFVTKTLAKHAERTNHHDRMERDLFSRIQQNARDLVEHAQWHAKQHSSSSTKQQQQHPSRRGCDQCSLVLLVEDLAFGLTAFLNTNATLPSPVIASIHSYIGQIRHQQGDFGSAISAFLAALWIHSNSTTTTIHSSSSSNNTLLEIAQTEHRLALAYGRSGQFQRALTLLETALAQYERAGVDCNHACHGHAREAYQLFREADQLEHLSLSRWNMVRQNHDKDDDMDSSQERLEKQVYESKRRISYTY